MIAFAIRAWWNAHLVFLMHAAIAVLTIFAAAKLGDEFRRLLIDNSSIGAIDLRIFQNLIRAWFAGRSIYREFSAAYPPASYVLGYALVGWLDFTSARWLWAATSTAMLLSLAILMIRGSLAESHRERVFVALMLLSMNATGVAIGNGQRILHLLPAILLTLLLLESGSRTLVRDLAAAALFLFALIQPSVTIPFGWLVLFSPGGWRPVILVAIGYSALTLFAASFQPIRLDALVIDWLTLGSSRASMNGYAHLSILLADLGMKASLVASALALVGLGWWTYRYRAADRWVLIGVTALVARFWVYHLVYDDVLVVLAMVALFRIIKREPENSRGVSAGVLLAITIAVMLFPARWEGFPSPWNWIFIGGHAIVWIADMIFLMRCAAHDHAQTAQRIVSA